MAKFKPSKERIRKVVPSNQGRPIIPNAGIIQWYADKLTPSVIKMTEDYRKEIMKVMSTEKAEVFFVGDASFSSIFNGVLAELNKKWSKIFEALGKSVAPDFVDKTERAAAGAADFSMKTAGIEQPRSTYSEHISKARQGYVKYNETLISGIQAKQHAKIYDAVMTSLTSPNPEAQGQVGIIKALNEIGINDKHRTKLIARDQTSKLYGALAVDRMKNNGVTYFRWQHVFGPGKNSNKGRVQWRESHMAMNGKIFSINDPDLWKVGKYFTRKGDIGIPGYAINCHCRMIPVVVLTSSDIEEIRQRYGDAAAMQLAA